VLNLKTTKLGVSCDKLITEAKKYGVKLSVRQVSSKDITKISPPYILLSNHVLGKENHYYNVFLQKQYNNKNICIMDASTGKQYRDVQNLVEHLGEELYVIKNHDSVSMYISVPVVLLVIYMFIHKFIYIKWRNKLRV
jgi:ABC-type bacteriocin/lantibiotic exporter with double-glycine peptidase domain